jgi:hypothetical protein
VAAHVGHDDVRDEQVDGFGRARDDLERFTAVRSRQDVVPQLREDVLGNSQDQSLVLDEEHGLVTACGGERRRGLRRGRALLSRAREIDPERRADPGLAFDHDGAARLPHDPLAHREA